MAYLIFQSDIDHKEAIPVTNEARGFSVGRHADCDLSVQGDTSTSRRHCVIRRASTNDPYMLDDLGSSNGTYVNGQRIWAASITLRDGDTLLVGNAELIFQLEPHDYELTSSTSIIVRPEKAAPVTATATSTVAEPSVMDTVKLDRNRDLPELPKRTPPPPQEQAALLAQGTDVNGYEIIRPLGASQYATVYLANQIALRRTVAIKVYRMNSSSRDFLEHFISVIQAAGRIQHPNIVSFLDAGADRGFCYVTMPFVPEGSIADRLAQRGPFPEATAREVMVRLAYAVEHAQSKYRLIHFDLKPSNILFNENQEPVITDFGLAGWMATYLQVNRKHFFGSPTYMCAEQILDRSPDWSCDMYALGTVFYEMLFGRPPFDAETPYRLIEKHLNEVVAFPKNIPVTPAILEVIRRMLAKTTDARFPNWQALIRELEVRKVVAAPKGAPQLQLKLSAEPRPDMTKSQVRINQDMTKSQLRIQKVTKPTGNIILPASARKPQLTLKKVLRKP